jgi:hypothetical protein
MPAQSAIYCAAEIRNKPRWEEAIPHARTFDGAGAILQQARAEIIVSEFCARYIPYKKRLHLFQSVLVSVLENVEPLGLLFQSSQKILQPGAYLRSQRSDGIYQPLYGSLNVRLFRISDGSPNEVVMDSIGLYEFGLPDVQMHFRNLDCGRVAGFLYSLAEYIFDNGDVIHDGNTTQGLTQQDRWRCKHEMSLIGPDRVVLDVDPGTPFAAGSRAR